MRQPIRIMNATERQELAECMGRRAAILTVRTVITDTQGRSKGRSFAVVRNCLWHRGSSHSIGCHGDRWSAARSHSQAYEKCHVKLRCALGHGGFPHCTDALQAAAESVAARTTSTPVGGSTPALGHRRWAIMAPACGRYPTAGAPILRSAADCHQRPVLASRVIVSLASRSHLLVSVCRKL